MIILGIDPGYAILGYGIVEDTGLRIKALDYGMVSTDPSLAFPSRLETLHLGVAELMNKYRPDHVVFEELFFYRNVSTALQVGAGRGVAILAAQQAAVPLYEYTPMQIKLAVTGNGHADKKQIQQMVRVLLNLAHIPKPDDAADALGVAICHANTAAHAREEFRIK